MSFSCFPDFISCLLACFLPFFFHPPCFLLSLPAILTHTHTHNKKEEEANTEIETSVVRQIIACILDFFIYVCTLFTPKPACFMHCVGGGMHFFFFFKYHASFESFSSENAKSLFGPSVPSRPAVCTYSVAAPRLACDFSTFFHAFDFFLFFFFFFLLFPICEGVWARQTTGC